MLQAKKTDAISQKHYVKFFCFEREGKVFWGNWINLRRFERVGHTRIFGNTRSGVLKRVRKCKPIRGIMRLKWGNLKFKRLNVNDEILGFQRVWSKISTLYVFFVQKFQFCTIFCSKFNFAHISGLKLQVYMLFWPKISISCALFIQKYRFYIIHWSNI